MENGIIYIQNYTPVPKQNEDKFSEKIIMSVDFRTGKVTGSLDEYYRNQKIVKGEDSMPTPKNISKESFIKAIKEHKTTEEAIKALGIAKTTFYKYKKIWAIDKAMDKPAESPAKKKRIGINEDFEKAVTEMVESSKPESQSEEPHQTSQAEKESFFGESSTFNPEPPNDNKISVLEAMTILEDLNEESDSIETIFECMKNQPWHPNIRSILLSHKLGVDRQIKRIEEALGTITVAI